MRKIILVISVAMMMANVGVFAQEGAETKEATQTTTVTQSAAQTTQQATTAKPIKKNKAEIAAEAKIAAEQAAKEAEAAKIAAEKEEQAKQQTAIEQKIRDLAKEEVGFVSNDVSSLKTKLLIAEIIAGLALIVAIVVIVLFFMEKKKFRDNILNLLLREDEQRMGEFIQKVADKARPISATSLSDYQPAKINQEELKQMIESYLSTKQAEDQKQQEIKAEQQRVFQQNQPKKFFADSIVENHFNKISDSANDDTVFELYLKKATDRTAEFSIYENAKRRVLKNADFIDGCDKQKINSNPVDLQIEKGTTVLQDNGKWQITSKAKVKFI